MGDRDVEVKFEDQQNINTFNKLNQRMHELETEIKARKTDAEDFEDADNELMLTDEEKVRYLVGECFLHMSVDEAQERLTSECDAVQQDLRELQQELADVKSKMKELKAILYGKFGNAINLEE